MKKILLIVLVLSSFQLLAQPTGYYNGTEGKSGDELKSELNRIISGHTPWFYFYAKHVFIHSDADPSNPGNVITVYKGSSVDGFEYGTGGDFLNREHVWSKSHGQFKTLAPTGCDLHNLKPVDGSVNVDKSNKDFANCQEEGSQHSEATGCYFTANAWEPRDDVKGDIARIIFYMATRYEGENGEVDLVVNDEVNNSPKPLYGRLSDLLEWNMQDLPDAFERNRNDVIFEYQQNRNPFIDNPEWVNMIWQGEAANSVEIADVAQSQELIFVNQSVDISALITGTGNVSAELHWGTTYTELDNVVVMVANGQEFTAQIPAQTVETDLYYSIVVTDDNGTYAPIVYNYYVEGLFTGTILPIAEVQGKQATSPYNNQTVTVTGVVTANFGKGFYIQDAKGAWNGIFVYDVLNPKVGDSVILTGKVKEYNGLTEIVEVNDYYLITRGNKLPDPTLLKVNEVSEAYEGVLVCIKSAKCSNEDLGYGVWEISDETGSIGVHNTPIYEFSPTLNTIYEITGPCKWDYGAWKIEIRTESDVLSGDHDAPIVKAINVVDAEKIMVAFDERLLESTAINVNNYSINKEVEVLQANESFPLSKIQLKTSSLAEGDYEITISNISDLAGNVMETKTIPFTYGGNAICNSSYPELKVYPNPTTNGVITIDGLLQAQSIQVFNVVGKSVDFIRKDKNQQRVSIHLLQHGVYFIHVFYADNTQNVVRVIAQ